MMPNADEQTQAKKEKQHAAREKLFRSRGLLMTLFILALALQLFVFLSLGGLWLGYFPYFNFAALILRPDVLRRFVTLLLLIFAFVTIWLEITKYRREEAKRAQEALLAERHRQIEGVWPPAPQKPE